MSSPLRIDGADLGACVPAMPAVPHYVARFDLRVDGRRVAAGERVDELGRVVLVDFGRAFSRPDLWPGSGRWWSRSWVGALARLQLLDEPPPGLQRPTDPDDPSFGVLYEACMSGVLCPPTPQVCPSACDCERRWSACPR